MPNPKEGIRTFNSFWNNEECGAGTILPNPQMTAWSR
jgi:hypothetical protein